MRPVRRINQARRWEDDFLDQDFDIYSEDFDDEEALDRGMKPNEVAFLRGFRKFN